MKYLPGLHNNTTLRRVKHLATRKYITDGRMNIMVAAQTRTR